ncbi:MAG TPA: hypothetical protein VGD40_02620 [Chryseosolibacter sp.]
MRRIFIPAVLCTIFPIALVLALFSVSDHMLRHHNGFVRQIPPHVAEVQGSIDLGFNSYYLAGASGTTAFLGNTTAPLHMLKVDVTALDTQHCRIQINLPDLSTLWFLKLRVDSTQFYLADGTVPVIYSGSIHDLKARRTSFDQAFFVDFQPVSQDRIVMRSAMAGTAEYELAIQTETERNVRIQKDVLEKQVDGHFCVDGMLHFSRSLARLVYVYYYRNQYIVTDTSLNVIGRTTTIDTVSKAKIALGHISSEKSVTFSAPPVFVNKQSAVDGKFLYIHSPAMAENEVAEPFQRVSVIDVYNLETNRYVFSFYLPHHQGKEVRDLVVRGGILTTLSGSSLVTYKLATHYFK